MMGEITMNDWKGLFKDHILARGEMYYYDDAVLELHKTEHGYHAIVEGSENYEVDIEIEAGNIGKMSCSCPYAEDGNYCKHMAAVLYEIEACGDTNLFAAKTDSIQLPKKIADIIDNASETKLRAFVKEIAESNSEIRNSIILRFTDKIDEKQINKLKQDVDQIVWQYGDRSGYIDYRNAFRFGSTLINYLEDKVDALIARKYLMPAFELINHVFMTLNTIDIDDSDGGISMIAGICYDKWQAVLQNCNKEEKNKMFSWFIDNLSNDHIVDYLVEYLEDILFHEFQDHEMLEKKLNYLDEKLAAQEADIDHDHGWSFRYSYENNIIKRLDLMKQLDYSQDEIKEYRKKYHRLSRVREMEIQENLRSGNIDEAIKLLQESKIMDKEHPGLVDGYCRQLISIYDQNKDKKAYKEELLHYVFEHYQNDLTYILQLKKISIDKEWNEYREQLLKKCQNHTIRYQILEMEGMYERMLEFLKKEKFVDNLNKYEKKLKEKYPEQVRDLYISYICDQAKHASDRNRYRELMNYLNKILKYPDGKEKVEIITNYWRTVYRRRIAMMDEMKKAGF